MNLEEYYYLGLFMLFIGGVLIGAGLSVLIMGAFLNEKA